MRTGACLCRGSRPKRVCVCLFVPRSVERSPVSGALSPDCEVNTHPRHSFHGKARGSPSITFIHIECNAFYIYAY